MSKEFSELKRRLDELTKLHARAVLAFTAAETIIKLTAPNIVGEREAKRNFAAVNRYKGLFNTAFEAYNYDLLMTLARIFVAHKDALYLERLVDYADQNRKKLTVDDFKEFHEDRQYLDELATSYEGLNNEELVDIKKDLLEVHDSIERLKTMRNEALAHINLRPAKQVSLSPQEMAKLIALSEKILNTLSAKHLQSISHFKELEHEATDAITGLAALARLETENPKIIRELLDKDSQG